VRGRHFNYKRLSCGINLSHVDATFSTQGTIQIFT